MKITFPRISSWTHSYSRRRGVIALLCLLCAGIILIFLWSIPLRESDAKERILWLIDASLSMGATETVGDVTTTRMNLVKESVSKLIESGEMREDGVMIFARDTRLVSPFSSDHAGVASFVRSISLIRYGGGSDLMYSLTDTLTSLFSSGNLLPSRIIMITDGGDEKSVCPDTTCRTLLEDRKRKNIGLTIVGVGNTEGSPIPTGTDIWGSPTYKTYNSKRVISARNDRNLRDLARETGGELVLFDPGEGEDWDRLLREADLSPNVRALLLILASILTVFGLFLPRFVIHKS